MNDEQFKEIMKQVKSIGQDVAWIGIFVFLIFIQGCFK